MQKSIENMSHKKKPGKLLPAFPEFTPPSKKIGFFGFFGEIFLPQHVGQKRRREAHPRRYE